MEKTWKTAFLAWYTDQEKNMPNRADQSKMELVMRDLVHEVAETAFKAGYLKASEK